MTKAFTYLVMDVAFSALTGYYVGQHWGAPAGWVALGLFWKLSRIETGVLPK